MCVCSVMPSICFLTECQVTVIPVCLQFQVSIFKVLRIFFFFVINCLFFLFSKEKGMVHFKDSNKTSHIHFPLPLQNTPPEWRQSPSLSVPTRFSTDSVTASVKNILMNILWITIMLNGVIVSWYIYNVLCPTVGVESLCAPFKQLTGGTMKSRRSVTNNTFCS